MNGERFAARFNGTTAWNELTPEQRAEIGGIALEIVVNFNGREAYEDCSHTRPFDAGEPILLDALHAAVSDAIPDTIDLEVLPVPSRIGQVCRRCGCTDNDACPEICAWAQPNLCTSCATNDQTTEGGNQ